MSTEDIDILSKPGVQDTTAPRDAIVIRGVTQSGHIFRPSDWAERLASVPSSFDINHRLSYSPYVQPTWIDGVKSVIVRKSLREIDAIAYEFVLGFARDNALVIGEMPVRSQQQRRATQPASTDQLVEPEAVPV